MKQLLQMYRVIKPVSTKKWENPIILFQPELGEFLPI